MDNFKFAAFGTTYNGRLRCDKYQRGGTSVELETEMEDLPGVFERFAVVSVRLPETEALPDGTFYGKHWSENEGLLEQLVQLGRIEPAPDVPVAASGFVEDIRAYRLCVPIQQHDA